MTRPGRRARGFTLLETMAVVAITGFLVATLTAMYVNIMNNTERATAGTRSIRVATAVLDRIAGDLEKAYVLARSEEDDPLEHPWLFIAEARSGQAGADRVMFTTLTHPGSGQADGRATSSGIATYAYWLEGDEDSGYDLVRQVSPTLAQQHAFPRRDSDGTVVVAEGLAAFSLHFLQEAGTWTEEWDSTALVDSSELPIAVEIRLALPPPLDEAELELREEFGEEIELREYRRRVVLYQRPLTREVALGLGSNGGGGGVSDEDNPECDVTWAQCLLLQRDHLEPAVFAELSGSGLFLGGRGNTCWEQGNSVNNWEELGFDTGLCER